MPTICSALNANLNADCNAKPIGGAEALMWLIPRQDWSAATIVTDTTNSPPILRSVVLPVGKRSYEFLVFKHGHKPRFQNKDSEFGTYFLQEIITSIQIYNNAVKAQIQALSDNYYVAIVENVNKTGDAVFEVYGTGYGLRIQDGAIRDLAANEGVYTCTFANDANYHEPTPPLSFCVLDTPGNTFSYVKTKAAILALTTATVAPVVPAGS